MDIEPASIEDAGEILTLQRAAWVTEAQIYGDPNLPPMTQTLEELEEDLQNMFALKALIGTRIVGSVRMRRRGTTGVIGRLMTAPDMQGRGIGPALMARLEQDAPAEIARFELFTGELSVRPIALYTKLGYTEFRRTEKPNGVNLVLMEKDRRR